MNGWNVLTDPEHFREVRDRSYLKPQLIFKHSVWCGTSAYVKDHLEASAIALKEHGLELNYLDLIHYRPISNLIAQELSVPHQSPQVILLADGKVVLAASHYAIDLARILNSLSTLTQGN